MTLFVSLALVRGFSDGSIDPADQPDAEAAAVYIHNPTAMHLRDMMLADYPGERPAKLLAATNDARAFGRALAELLACPIEEQFGPVPPLVADMVARRDPLDELPDAWRSWLTLGLGFDAEMGGGGCFVLRKTHTNGWSIMLTCAEGGGMPEADSWHVGVYAPKDSDAAWQEMHNAASPSPISFRQAVNAAFAMAEAGEAAPPRDIVREALSACIDAMTPTRNTEEETAAALASEALHKLNKEG